MVNVPAAGPYTNNTVRRVDIIRTVPTTQIRARSIINLGAIEGASYNDYSFEDI
jgi:hypothetical protein